MLGESDIEKLRPLLQTSGWREVVVRLVEERQASLQQLMLMLPAERPKPYTGLPDDDVVNLIRGDVRCCKWLLTHFANEVAVYDHNRRRDELAAQNV